MTKNFNGAVQQAGLAAMLALATMASPLAQAQGAEGMRIAKDPITGELRALTADEHKALDAKSGAGERSKASSTRREAATGNTSEPTQILHNGPAKVKGGRMNDELMSQSIMVRRADGTLQEVCVDPTHAHSVISALQAAAKPSPAAALETE